MHAIRTLAAAAALTAAIGVAAPALATPPDTTVLVAHGQELNAAVRANAATLDGNGLTLGTAVRANGAAISAAARANGAAIYDAASANGLAMGTAVRGHAAALLPVVVD